MNLVSNEPFQLTADWKLPKTWGEWALAERKTWNVTFVRKLAERFRSYHVLKKDTRNHWGEWELAWRAWVNNEKSEPLKQSDKKFVIHCCSQCDLVGFLTFDNEVFFCSRHVDLNRRPVFSTAAIFKEMEIPYSEASTILGA